MRTLLSDRCAPVTSAIGFLEAPLQRAADTLLTWRRHLYGDAAATALAVLPLDELLAHLEPLTAGVRPRELLVATAGPWSAYFDCGFAGGDPTSAIGYLSQRIGCRGVTIASIPDTAGTKHETPGRWGAVQFELFGPDPTDFLNYVRTVSAVNDGGRWRFHANGEVQDFEDLAAYARRRKRERFTSHMLADYCAALGLRPLDEDFYKPRAVLLESSTPEAALEMTLPEAQARQGIVPGVADSLPG
jgi:hypothetical protein